MLLIGGRATDSWSMRGFSDQKAIWQLKDNKWSRLGELKQV